MTYNVFGVMLNLAQSNPDPITNWFMYAYSLSPVCLFYVHTYIYITVHYADDDDDDYETGLWKSQSSCNVCIMTEQVSAAWRSSGARWLYIL